MSNVHIMNHGPGPVVVFDAAGMRADLGEGAHGTFSTPLSVTDTASGAADSAPAEPSPAPAAETKVTLDAVVTSLDEFVSPKTPEELQAQADAELAPTT